jgi:hypothetical protein
MARCLAVEAAKADVATLDKQLVFFSTRVLNSAELRSSKASPFKGIHEPSMCYLWFVQQDTEHHRPLPLLTIPHLS